MSGRACKNGFLKEYLEYISGTEVPDYFGLWCAISIINTCLGRRCFIGVRPPVYPNMYIVLVAESALCRKSTAIDQSMNIYKALQLPPKLFAQKTNASALIESMQTLDVPIVSDSQTGETTKPRPSAQGLIVVDELKTLLDREAFSSGLVVMLTKLWDSSRSSFTYHTRMHGEETISDPCISLLGGTTIDWLRASIPEDAIGGGFTSRIIFVHEKRTNKFIALPTYSDDLIETEAKLVEDLNAICKIEGEYKLSPKAVKYFTHRYKGYLESTPFLSTKELSGYAGRRHDMLHKVAMAVAASNSDRLMLTDTDYMTADDILKQAETNMPHVIQTAVASESGTMTMTVLRYITTSGVVTQTELTRRFSHQVRALELQAILDTLCAANSVKMFIKGRGVSYQVVEDEQAVEEKGKDVFH